MSGKGGEQAGPPELEATMKDMLAQPGVVGYLVFNSSGIPVKWSSTGFRSKTTTGGATSHPIPPEVTHYAALISDLTVKCKATCKRVFRDEEPEASDLVYFRLRTSQHEIIVAPGDGCTLVVLQGMDEEPVVVAEDAEEEEGDASKK